MILTGILSESLGGIITFRGFASGNEIVNLSYPYQGYQRKEDRNHLNELAKFIKMGKNSFSPEVVLAYTLKFDYNKRGKKPVKDPLSDILDGIGFKSNIDNISIKIKQNKTLENGQLCTITIPNTSYEQITDRPFRRVDGNHRLHAIEKVLSEGQSLGKYLIPFCIILFIDDDSLKSEKVIFHNINSKAVPIKSEELLKGILSTQADILTFSETELVNDFGTEYAFARKISENRTLMIEKLKSVEWVGDANVLSVLVDLISHIQTETKTPITQQAQKEAFCEALSRALDQRERHEEKFKLPSGMLYLLTRLYYKLAIKTIAEDIETKTIISNLLAWSKRYDLNALQVHDTKNCITNANCIHGIFDQYMNSSFHTIFMSRCFSTDYNENERAIQRVIDKINSEKNIKIKLHRVDRGEDPTTGDIFQRIKNDIATCGLMIADLSGGKPNVHHEIGLAMGMNKKLFMIHRGTHEDAIAHTPSNLNMFEQIRFKDSEYAQLEAEIYKKLIAFYKL